MIKYIKWGFWTLIYFFRPVTKEFGNYLKMGERTRPPWWKFKPNLWYNKDGKEWEIFFTEEQSHVEHRIIQVEARIGMETGNITGLIIYDNVLKGIKDAPKS